MPADTRLVVCILLPALSVIAFHLSNKYYATQKDENELFEDRGEPQPSIPNASAEKAENSNGSKGELELPKDFAYLTRLIIALACCAFVFGTTSASLFNGFSTSLMPGSLIESICCVALSIVCCFVMFVSKQKQDLYQLYRLSPVSLIIGVMLFVFADAPIQTAGVFFINLGYLSFEISALNDFCIASKSQKSSLVRTFAIARIGITVGMALGWIACTGLHALAPAQTFFNLLLFVCATVIVVSSTVVFTAKEVFEARIVTSNQEKSERLQERIDSDAQFQADVHAYAELYGLSARESEIAERLLQGRTINYIAEQLFIAPGTVKTHMHNIYGKVDVHSKMELLDSFEDFRRKQE